MYGAFDGSVLVLHSEDHDTAAPNPVHLPLEPVGAGCELMEWSDSSRQQAACEAAVHRDSVTARGVDWDTTELL